MSKDPIIPNSPHACQFFRPDTQNASSCWMTPRSLPTFAIEPQLRKATKVLTLSSLQAFRSARNVNIEQKQVPELSLGKGIYLQRKNRGRYSKT